MKLLSWIRAITKSGLDPSKDLKGDFSCLRSQTEVRTNSFSFSHDPKPPRVEEELGFDEDGFCGFLAIGTLGTDPETPKFAASVRGESVTGEKGQIAKLIAEKLDKFLEENPDNSSSKLVERSDAEGDRDSKVLQDYNPFHELTTRTSVEVRRKKSLLTSLFKKRRTIEGEAFDWSKRIFEKLQGSSTKTKFYDDTIPKKKDLRKSVRIFRRKVHPVLSTPTRDNNKIDDRRSCDFKVPSLTGGSLRSGSISKANRKRETWINTDAEYHVLEL